MKTPKLPSIKDTFLCRTQKAMKKLISFFVATLLLLSSAHAQLLQAPSIAAKAWLLLDLNSGQMLASKKPYERVEPASLTKLMTAYIVFGAIRDDKIDLDDNVKVSVKAWKVEPGSSRMFIEPSKPVTVRQLLLGLIVQSGNDAAIALAEAVSGDIPSFVVLMNREATRMGMNATRFANPHGLPHKNNYSTAFDLGLLAAHMTADHPDLYKMYSIKTFTYNKIKQSNRNRLLWLDPTVDGLKTGHTKAAGYCLIASSKRKAGKGERRMLSVVMGAVSSRARASESLKLMNWGFRNFDTVKIYERNQVLTTLEVWKGSKGEVRVGFDHDTYVTVPKGTASRLKQILEYKDLMLAPIPKNSRVATLKMVIDGNTVAELPVVALESVNHASVFGRAWDSMILWLKK